MIKEKNNKEGLIDITFIKEQQIKEINIPPSSSNHWGNLTIRNKKKKISYKCWKTLENGKDP